MDITTNTFDTLDEYIKRCLGDRHAENALIDAYFEFWMGLKNRVGTASGFTGLSEYLFFRYILMSLERRTDELFILEERTKSLSENPAVAAPTPPLGRAWEPGPLVFG